MSYVAPQPTAGLTLSEPEIRRLIVGVGRDFRIPLQDMEEFVQQCWIATRLAEHRYRGDSEAGYVKGIARNQALNNRQNYVYRARLAERLSAKLAGEKVRTPCSRSRPWPSTRRLKLRQ